MQAPIKQYTLPFLLQSERNTLLDANVEAAAIYAFSELERKSGGLLGKQSEERISFIMKMGYPLLLIPREETTYIFDGLNKSNYNWIFYETTNTEFAFENLEAASKLKETYLSFLVDSQKRFDQTLTRKDIMCNGLIANNGFFEELNIYRREAVEITNQSSSVIPLLATLEESKVNLVLNEIETLQRSFREKTENLKQILQLINKTTSQYITGLQFEADALKEEAQAKIKAQEEIINPKVLAFTKEYQSRIKHFERNIEAEENPLEKQKSKIEKTRKTLEIKIIQYFKNAKAQAKKNNSDSEKNWKRKASWTKKELSVLQKQHERITKQLSTLMEYKTNEINRIKFELQEIIKHERQPIIDIESSRDARLMAIRQEISVLEKETKAVLEKIDTSIKQRENLLSRIEPLGVKNDPKMKKNALLYVPFYITCFSGLGKRYLVFPPSVLGKIGFSAKIKGVFGRTKINDIVNPRFRTLTALVDKIRLDAAGRSEFRDELEKLAQKNNVLSTNSSQIDISKGLFNLRMEGWLSETEYQALVKSK